MSAEHLHERVQRDRAEMEGAMRSERAADGSEIRIARFGSGEALVCVPSVPEVDFVYMPQIRHLADRYQVIIYEPRLSRTQRVGLDVRQAELSAVMDIVSSGPVHLLAWSDSGSIAYRAVRSRSDRFRSVALLGLPDRYAFPGPVHAFAQLLYRRPIDRTVPAFALSALLARYLGGPRFSRRWVFGEAQRIQRLPQYVRNSILPLMLEHRADDIGVPVPALLVGGDHDALVTVEQMRRMAGLLNAAAEFVVIPRGEHMLGYVSPDEVNDALDHFYASVEAASPDVAGVPR